MHVAVVARDAARLEDVAERLRRRGVRAAAVPADVSDEQAQRSLIGRVEADLGPVDVLVNNAGIELSLAYHRTPYAEIDRVMAVNLTAPMRLTRAVLPGMIERKRGHLVFISSLAGKTAVPYNASYAASKAGLIYFAQSLRAELRGSGVSASSVSPGYVSEVGMYVDKMVVAGAHASRMAGMSSPRQVANGVLKAITRDQPDVIVNSVPLRPFFAFSAVAPKLAHGLLPVFGVAKTMRAASAANRNFEGD
jgi:short-subunit dehydrogenase